MSTREPFWDLAAVRLLSGVICMEMEAAIAEGRPAAFEQLIHVLFAHRPIQELEQAMKVRPRSRFVRRAIEGGFLGVEVRNMQESVVAMAQSYMSLLISDDLLPAVNTSSISLKEIQASTDFTLYVVIPPNKLDSHASLLKIWISTLLYAIMERSQTLELPTLFMLDECANLGELDLLKKAITLMRGYGLKVWMFFQDLSQLDSLYKESSRTMINNCGVLQTFGANRKSAAQPLASIMGYYSASDIQDLDRNHQVLSLPPRKPTTARMMKYYSDDAFAGRFSPNPLIRPKGHLHSGAASRLVDRGYMQVRREV